MSKLFTSLTIRDITFKNRIAMSPMCQYSATDGFASDFHYVHYGSRAIGGAGLIIQEATAVSPEGRITPGDLGLWDDRHTEKLTGIVDFIHEHGAMAAIQLAHAGRKAGCARPWDGDRKLTQKDGGWTAVAPSAIPFYPEDEAPQALDRNGIKKVVSDFRDATQRALTAGYDVVEIHAAHGYLIHQFLSPISNRRTDEYGGSYENRIRLLIDIVDGVRSVWPDKLPLFVRLSSTDWVEGGWNPEETAKLASILKSNGVDLIDCSSGGMVPYAKIPFGPGYQVPFAEKIKREAGILTGAVGLINRAEQAEEILQNSQADLIMIGRELLRNPHFSLYAAHTLGEVIEWPRQYRRAKI